MMLKRKIEKEIMHWIESSDKALLIYGVRQAGKTFIIRECLKAAGCDYIEFNLIRQPEIVEILARGKSAHRTGCVPGPVFPLPPLHTSPPSYRLHRLKKRFSRKSISYRKQHPFSDGAFYFYS